jgi:hypothetical protein
MNETIHPAMIADRSVPLEGGDAMFMESFLARVKRNSLPCGAVPILPSFQGCCHLKFGFLDIGLIHLQNDRRMTQTAS